LGSASEWLTGHAHNRERFTIFFLPREWQEVISAKGWVLLTGFVAFEIFNLVSPFRVMKLDHFAHLGGYLIGAVWALAWKGEQKKRRQNRTWFERVMSE
jgi:rhomboid-like protein